ncbi:MAG: putative metallopeptidase [Methanococcaceae archaeon]
MEIENNDIEFLERYNNKKTKAPIKREFVISEDMKFMAEEIIKRERIDIHPAKIEYVTVEPNISKTTAAKCIKTGKELKFFSNLDYVIEVSGELWTALDEPTKEILLEHELRHILVIQNDKSGDWGFKLRKHDIQDFGRIVSKHGIDWIKKVKLGLSSLYDLTPAEEDNIQI